MLNLMKSRVELSQFLATGRKGTAPSIAKTMIEKLFIPRLKAIELDGIQIENTLNEPLHAGI